jgi:hypothetical protein
MKPGPSVSAASHPAAPPEAACQRGSCRPAARRIRSLRGRQLASRCRGQRQQKEPRAAQPWPGDIGGGIVLVTGGEPGGPHFGPLGDTLRKNVTFRNKPFGTFWDRTDRIRFKDNRCATSQPGRLCD